MSGLLLEIVVSIIIIIIIIIIILPCGRSNSCYLSVEMHFLSPLFCRRA
jgi:hypothetical protein